MNRAFSIAEEHPPRDGMTISTMSGIRSETKISYFSLGRGTDISAGSYPTEMLCIGAGGTGRFALGAGADGKEIELGEGEALIVPKNTLCGSATREGFVYTEVITKGELQMNEALKAGEVFRLADLVPYEKGSVVNMDVVSNEGFKFVVMAFDEGTGLSPHRAPGDALIFALEGRGVIGYEGQDYPIGAGENFRFAKGGLHSVTANGKFKMALLLTLK
ncbi:cupin domain-containing protein [Pyramidobacter piscolens]|uniref:cupin domain-containing protein n=1 Tax=Pyramidobacter piscolens TaxID=638849 RepID=UPI0026668F22|nr:cupin domain-containing protein [Pyramidobacter piscolens]